MTIISNEVPYLKIIHVHFLKQFGDPQTKTKQTRNSSPMSWCYIFIIWNYIFKTAGIWKSKKMQETWTSFWVFHRVFILSTLQFIELTWQYNNFLSFHRLVYLLLRIGQDLLIWLPTGVVSLSGEYKSLSHSAYNDFTSS